MEKSIPQVVLENSSAQVLLVSVKKKKKSKLGKNQKTKALVILRRVIEALLTHSKTERMDYDENLNDYDESEMKLIVYQMGIAILLNLIIISMFISIPIITLEYKPPLVMPHIPNQFGEYILLRISTVDLF